MMTLYIKQMILCTTIVFAEIHLHLVRRRRRYSEFDNLIIWLHLTQFCRLRMNLDVFVAFWTDFSPGLLTSIMSWYLQVDIWPLYTSYKWITKQHHMLTLIRKSTFNIWSVDRIWLQNKSELIIQITLHDNKKDLNVQSAGD